MEYPEMIHVRQQFDAQRIEDIEGAVMEQMRRSGAVFRAGERIAITCGSRGVYAIHRIIKAIVAYVKAQGAVPFIVPAMGSHGGATAEGQVDLLAGYGVTEEYCGAPIVSSMETVSLGADALGHPVYMDKNAYESDGVVIVNRVKPHTDFHGEHESGIIKMCVIGLGKQKQALQVHREGAYGLKNHILPAARVVLSSGKIRMGIGVVENAYDQTCLVRGVLPEDFEQADIDLLAEAWRNMPKLPVDELDVLVVDELGKDISGTGIDTNIIGRMYIEGQAEPEKPHIKVIIVTDLTENTHGNGTGIGLADLTTKRVVDKLDEKSVRANTYTSTFLRRAAIPMAMDTDKEALQYAFRCCGPVEPKDARVIRIHNTLMVSDLLVSPAVWEEIRALPHITRCEDEPSPLIAGDDLPHYPQSGE